MLRLADETHMQEVNTVSSSEAGQPVSPTGNLTIVMIGSLPLDLTQVKGGVEAVILNLFYGFRERPEIRIVHLAFTKETQQPKTIQFADNIVIHFLPFKVRFEMADYLLNEKSLKAILESEKPQIIHIQEITPHLIRLLKYNKGNIVVTQHGIMREELKYATGFSQKLKCLFKAGVEKFVFPTFPHVIFISKYNQELYPPKPVHGIQIFNPVNPIFFSDSANGEVRKNTLVYVGVLSRRKNIRIVIEALHELKKDGKVFTLNVIGGFKEQGYEKEIMGLVDEFGLKDQIIFHGWMKQEQIREIYAHCPLFILPSQQETLPVSIGEAMALGKVVIASDVGAIREMFSDGVSGFLFRKNDLKDLARVLQSVYNNPGLSAIGQRAKKEAHERFHPSLIVEKTIRFYREVIKQNNPKQYK